MASERTEPLPEVLREWLDERAEETGRSREELLARSLALYRILEEGEGETEFERRLRRVESELEDVEEGLEGRLRRVRTRMVDVEDDFEEKLADVRSRVVQVKHETDKRAAADHEHPELVEAVELLAEQLDDVETRLNEVSKRIDAVERRLDEGFDNYEGLLENLLDETDEVDEKLTRLASAAVDLREREGRLEAIAGRRRAVDDLREAAIREDVTKARCGDCDMSLPVAMLTEPNCPHCGATFVEVEPAANFFDTPTLVTGDRPALDPADVKETEFVEYADDVDDDILGE